MGLIRVLLGKLDGISHLGESNFQLQIFVSNACTQAIIKRVNHYYYSLECENSQNQCSHDNASRFPPCVHGLATIRTNYRRKTQNRSAFLWE